MFGHFLSNQLYQLISPLESVLYNRLYCSYSIIRPPSLVCIILFPAMISYTVLVAAILF